MIFGVLNVMIWLKEGDYNVRWSTQIEKDGGLNFMQTSSHYYSMYLHWWPTFDYAVGIEDSSLWDFTWWPLRCAPF